MLASFIFDAWNRFINFSVAVSLLVVLSWLDYNEVLADLSKSYSVHRPVAEPGPRGASMVQSLDLVARQWFTDGTLLAGAHVASSTLFPTCSAISRHCVNDYWLWFQFCWPIILNTLPTSLHEMLATSHVPTGRSYVFYLWAAGHCHCVYQLTNVLILSEFSAHACLCYVFKILS